MTAQDKDRAVQLLAEIVENNDSDISLAINEARKLLAKMKQKPTDAPKCRCGSPCQCYSPGNYSVQCRSCNERSGVRRRAAATRLRKNQTNPTNQ